jgi:hypothetical protein
MLHDVIVPPGRALRVKGGMSLDFEVYRARLRVSEAHLVSPKVSLLSYPLKFPVQG